MNLILRLVSRYLTRKADALEHEFRFGPYRRQALTAPRWSASPSTSGSSPTTFCPTRPRTRTGGNCMGKDDYKIEDDGRPTIVDGRITLVPTGDEGDTERPPPPDFADTLVDTEDDVHLFV